MRFYDNGTSFSAATTICLTVTLGATLVGGELFYRLVECPAQALSRFTFDWIRE